MTWQRRMLGVALAAGVAVALAWPRGPRLQWYTSPAVKLGAESFRIQILAPEGWVWDKPAMSGDKEGVWFTCRSSPPLSALPDWIRRLLIDPHDYEKLSIVARPGNGRALAAFVERVVAVDSGGGYCARGGSGLGVGFDMSLCSPSEASVNAKYRRVLDSLKVLPP
jgi:hypothetical protein